MRAALGVAVFWRLAPATRTESDDRGAFDGRIGRGSGIRRSGRDRYPLADRRVFIVDGQKVVSRQTEVVSPNDYQIVCHIAGRHTNSTVRGAGAAGGRRDRMVRAALPAARPRQHPFGPRQMALPRRSRPCGCLIRAVRNPAVTARSSAPLTVACAAVRPAIAHMPGSSGICPVSRPSRETKAFADCAQLSAARDAAWCPFDLEERGRRMNRHRSSIAAASGKSDAQRLCVSGRGPLG